MWSYFEESWLFHISTLELLISNWSMTFIARFSNVACATCNLQSMSFRDSSISIMIVIELLERLALFTKFICVTVFDWSARWVRVCCCTQVTSRWWSVVMYLCRVHVTCLILNTGLATTSTSGSSSVSTRISSAPTYRTDFSWTVRAIAIIPCSQRQPDNQIHRDRPI